MYINKQTGVPLLLFLHAIWKANYVSIVISSILCSFHSWLSVTGSLRANIKFASVYKERAPEPLIKKQGREGQSI